MESTMQKLRIFFKGTIHHENVYENWYEQKHKFSISFRSFCELFDISTSIERAFSWKMIGIGFLLAQMKNGF